MLINDTGNYKITAVIKDIPKQSHFNFDFFVPMIEDNGSKDTYNWLSDNWNTYLLLKKNADVKQVKAQLNPMMDKYVGPELKSVINQSLDEFKKSGGYVRAGNQLQTVQRLFVSKPFSDQTEHGHVPLGPFDSLFALCCQANIFYVIFK